MRITKIGYGKLITTGDFNNRKLYMEAEISKTDDPKKCFDALKDVVERVSEEDEWTLNDDDIPF